MFSPQNTRARHTLVLWLFIPWGIPGEEVFGVGSFTVNRQGIDYMVALTLRSNVREDVAFGPLNLGKVPAEAWAIERNTLETLGIIDFGSRVSHKLSHGEKKLVALASVLAMDPEVLILDEPAAGLGHETRDRLMGILSNLDLTLVITSHEMDFMSRMASIFYAIADGRMEKAGHIVSHTHTHIHVGGDYSHRHEDEYH